MRRATIDVPYLALAPPGTTNADLLLKTDRALVAAVQTTRSEASHQSSPSSARRGPAGQRTPPAIAPRQVARWRSPDHQGVERGTAGSEVIAESGPPIRCALPHRTRSRSIHTSFARYSTMPPTMRGMNISGRPTGLLHRPTARATDHVPRPPFSSVGLWSSITDFLCVRPLESREVTGPSAMGAWVRAIVTVSRFSNCLTARRPFDQRAIRLQ